MTKFSSKNNYLPTLNFGFTLLELLVTMMITGILMMYAVPAFTNSIAGFQMSSNISGLTGALNLARNEAIARNVRVTMAPSIGTTFDHGITVFIDENNNATKDSNEEILHLFPSTGGSGHYTSSPGSVTYLPRGFVLNRAIFQLCDSRTNEWGRMVAISLSGGIRTKYSRCA